VEEAGNVMVKRMSEDFNKFINFGYSKKHFAGETKIYQRRR
jgi:hypothetical protein